MIAIAFSPTSALLPLIGQGLGMGGGVQATPTDATGIEFATPDHRLHWRQSDNKLHFAVPDHRLHWRSTEH